MGKKIKKHPAKKATQEKKVDASCKAIKIGIATLEQDADKMHDMCLRATGDKKQCDQVKKGMEDLVREEKCKANAHCGSRYNVWCGR